MRTKKLFSILLALIMICGTLTEGVTVYAADPPSEAAEIGAKTYATLSEAIAEAGDGDIVKLIRDVNESVAYAVKADKTITIDGQGHGLYGVDPVSKIEYSAALKLSGDGLIKLKNITLQDYKNANSTTSCGLYVRDSVNVYSEGEVTARSDRTDSGSGCGLYCLSMGTVNIKYASGTTCGVFKDSAGTVNIRNAFGIDYGALNFGDGVLNVHHAEGKCAVRCDTSTNVNEAITTKSLCIENLGTDMVICASKNGTTIGDVNESHNKGLLLKKGAGTSCVLDFITIDAQGATKVGNLPNVAKNGIYSNEWYLDYKKTPFSGTWIDYNIQTLYSSSYAFYSVSGKITGYGAPGGVSAKLQLKDSAGNSVGNSIDTSIDGTFAIPGVEPGKGYTVKVVPRDTYSIGGTVVKTKYAEGSIGPFDVEDENVTGLDLCLNKKPLKVGSTGDYATLENALAVAEDGVTIYLVSDIDESVKYTVTKDKTITIDGQGYKIVGVKADLDHIPTLSLDGAGIVKLKNITLQGHGNTNITDSCGLFAAGNVSVDGDDNVKALGGDLKNSYGLINTGTGTVSVGEAIGGTALWNSIGVRNENENGTVNVKKAEGGAQATLSCGIYISKGTVNVKKAEGGAGAASSCGIYIEEGTANADEAAGCVGMVTGASGYGVYNESGIVNIKSANGGPAPRLSCGVYNLQGTVNADTAIGSIISLNGKISCGVDNRGGIVNVATAEGITVPVQNDGGKVNSGGTETARLELKRDAGTSCVLDSITVAATGSTQVGTLPFVFNNGAYSSDWYKDSAKKQLFSGTAINGEAALYNSFYTTYKVNIGTLAGGSITATPAVAAAGGTVNLTVTPNSDKQLKSGSLKYNDGTSDAAITGSSFIMPAADLTVTAEFEDIPSGNHPSNGGKSSGTTGPSTADTTATTVISGNTTPVVTSTTNAEAKNYANGKAAATVTESQVTEAVNKAVAGAEKNGQGTEAKVEIKVAAMPGVGSIETNLPKKALDAVAGSNASALTVSTPVADITFDGKSLDTISGEAAGDVKITAAKVDTGALSQEAKQVVGDRPVFDFSVTSGDKNISQFGGTVTVSIPYTPKAGEDTNSIVIYYINAEGKPEAVTDCRYDPATGRIIFTTNHFSQYAVGYNKVNFSDVAASAWYSDAVNFVAARGIATGTGNGKFSPKAELTRGQFLVMVMRAYGLKASEKYVENFTDAGNTYYTGYLAAAKKLGITTGVGNNMFAPDKTITRQEMVALLYNTLKQINELPASTEEKTLTAFSDANKVASWAEDAMTLFVKTGTISGSGGKLNPDGTTDRAQIAQVLYNLQGEAIN